MQMLPHDDREITVKKRTAIESHRKKKKKKKRNIANQRRLANRRE